MRRSSAERATRHVYGDELGLAGAREPLCRVGDRGTHPRCVEELTNRCRREGVTGAFRMAAPIVAVADLGAISKVA